MFSSAKDRGAEEQMYGSRDDSGIVLILFNTAKEGGLCLFSLIFHSTFSSDDVAPIAAEHGMSLATACLSIGHDSHIETLAYSFD